MSMNRIGKLTRTRMPDNNPAPVPAWRSGKIGLAMTPRRGIIGLSVLLVGGLGAFLMSSSASDTAPPAPLSVASTPVSAGKTERAQLATTVPAPAGAANQTATQAPVNPTAESNQPAASGWVSASEATPAFRMEPLPQLAGTAALRGLMAKAAIVEGVRHASGGGRDDALIIGDPDVAGPLFRLSLYRPGSEPQPGGSFFVDVARRTGETGMWVERFVTLPSLESRLGAVDIALARFGGHAGARNCVAFRQSRTQPELRVSGWICLDGESVPAPEAVACVIDAVRWERTQDEPQLATLFGGAARAPNSACTQPSAGDLTSSIRPVDDHRAKAGARR